MEQKTFEYEIGGKKYLQKPLVLGQIEQLIELLDGLALPESLDMASLLRALGGRVSKAIAIVLTEDGVPLRDKDLEETARAIRFSISPETSVKVVEDFFGINLSSSLVKELTAKVEAARGKLGETRSKISASPLPEETSPGGTPSSGGSP